MTNASNVRRDFEHYAAHGANASIVYRHVENRAQIELRHGRDDIGEHVQLEIKTTSEPDKRGNTRSQYASLSFTKEQWDAIVEHVKENRAIERPSVRERLAQARAAR